MGHALHRLPLNATGQRPRHLNAVSTRTSISPAAATAVLRTVGEFGDAEESVSTAFTSAVRLYEDGHWEFAFERLTALDDDGHAPAAKLALLMLRYGRALYGKSFSARPAQVARWAQRVLKATPSVASRSAAPAATMQ
jgi:hypothetical protein